MRISILEGAYDIESLNDEMKRIIIEEGHFTQANFPFTFKPNFSTLGSFVETSRQKPLLSFSPCDSKRNLVRFNADILYEEYNLSHNPVDNLSFDNTLLECGIAQRNIFKVKRSAIAHEFTIDVDPGHEYTGK